MVKRPSKPPSKPLLRESEPPLRGGRRRPRDPQQPNLPFDKMPTRIEPCLALLKPKAPTGSDWIYEIKWDGYRLQLNKSGTDVTIITRGGHDWTDRFPTIVEAAKALPVGTVILDGEAVVLDEVGRSDFSALQQALGGRSGKRHASEAIFIAFDCLYLDGHDLRQMEQDARRHLLEGLVPAEADGGIRLSQEIEATVQRSSRRLVNTGWKASSPNTVTSRTAPDAAANGLRSSASNRRRLRSWGMSIRCWPALGSEHSCWAR